MSKYILAYDMLCFLSCTRYSLWVYQCSLVYRFMINLFSIYKKALLIPRSGLDELPDTTLFGLLIYWNDLQLSSHAFPEHNRNQLSMNEVSEGQGQSCSFWDLRQARSHSQQEMVSGGTMRWMGTAAALSGANERGQTVFCAPTERYKETMEGQAHAVPSCPGTPMPTGSPACEYTRCVRVRHTVNRNLSRVQGLLLLVCLRSWKKLSRCMNFDALGAYSPCTHQPLHMLAGISDTVWLLIEWGGQVETWAKQVCHCVCCAIRRLNLSGSFSKHASVVSDINVTTTVNQSFMRQNSKKGTEWEFGTPAVYSQIFLLSAPNFYLYSF